MKIEHKGRIVLIDECDLEIFKSMPWHFNDTNVRHTEHLIYKGNLLHRLIMGVTDRKVQVDHINGDGLDNRRINLRLATHAENLRNQQVREYTALGKKKTSKYKGVCITSNRIRASITVDGYCIKLGSFKKEEDAAKAYNEAAVKHFGNFAVLNIIE